MKTCYRCGEHKKVREIIDFDGKFMKVKQSYLGALYHYSYDYICEDCDKARKILRVKEGIEKQKDWVKQRDKILKENKE